MSDDEPPTRTERLFLRMTIMQTVMTAAAVIISMAALYAAFVQAESARKQTEAAVWPYVDIGNTIVAEDGEARGVVFMENTGIGPARVRAVRVRVDGAAQPNWTTALEAVGIEDRFGYINMTNQVLSPEQTLSVLRLRDPRNGQLLRNMWEDRFEISYCYCSVFDQCWIQSDPEMETPEEVDQCPAWDGERFEN